MRHSKVRDIGLGGADDARIHAHAKTNGLVLVTRDLDFSDIRNYPPAEFAGIIVLQLPDDAIASVVARVLETFPSQPQLLAGVVGRLAPIAVSPPPPWSLCSRAMEDMTAFGNQIEALLWFGFSLGFSWKGLTSDSPERRRLSWVLAVAFAVFGVSDLIEARTGAWWRPIWLFVLKSGCVAVFAYGFWAFRGFRQRERSRACAETDPDAAR